MPDGTPIFPDYYLLRTSRTNPKLSENLVHHFDHWEFSFRTLLKENLCVNENALHLGGAPICIIRTKVPHILQMQQHDYMRSQHDNKCIGASIWISYKMRILYALGFRFFQGDKLLCVVAVFYTYPGSLKNNAEIRKTFASSC